eukprot:1193212-Prorocentrum_minimum.AAC.11
MLRRLAHAQSKVGTEVSNQRQLLDCRLSLQVGSSPFPAPTAPPHPLPPATTGGSGGVPKDSLIYVYAPSAGRPGCLIGPS